MKTTVGVFFGGRSTEHEISVISALQAINAFNKEKYEIIPIYITKQGRWFSGDALLEVKKTIATWLPCKTCAPRFT